MAFLHCRHVLLTAVLFSIFYFANSTSNSRIITLDEDNWTDMLEGEWMVEFFAPWCPACKVLDPTWKEFADWSKELDIQVAQVDVTVNPGMSGRFLVTALPTIFHVIKGEFRQYRGTRDKEHFISFIEEKQWQSIEELPAWKSPSSILMSLISYFFKLSMILRSVHTKLIEEYGVPYWGSYLIFALSTIVVGAIFGLILVCIIDFVFPAKAALPIIPRTEPSLVLPPREPKSEEKEDGEEAKSNDEEQKSSEEEKKLNDEEQPTAENEAEEKGSTVEDLKGEDSTVTSDVRKRITARKDN